MSAPIFYKATRVDGTDFRTGTILYTVGKTVRPHPSPTRQICGPGYLHASPVPAESLIGGHWPCRLFEVTGKVAAGLSGHHWNKAAFKQLKVIREIDAHLALGPNGRYIAGIIERTRKLTYEEARSLHAASGTARGTAWEAARAAAWEAAWEAEWEATWGAAWEAARAAAWEAAWEAARGAAWEAAWGAVLALCVRDLITPEQFEELYGPWRKVIGDPSEAVSS